MFYMAYNETHRPKGFAMLDRAIELAEAQHQRMTLAYQNGKTREEFYSDPAEAQTSVLINDMLLIYASTRTSV